MKLSVVIAAHDEERHLEAALESVLRGAPDDAEVMVVDDGSTDATQEILAAHAERIRVLRNETATGPGRARNLGANSAHGEILAFHDGDDLFLPGRFSALVDVLDADPGVDLAFGNGIKCDESGRPLGPVIPARYSRRLSRRAGIAEMLIGGFVYPQGLCIRRKRFLATGGFVPERVEDREFALRAGIDLRLRFVDRPVFAYRRHDGSMTMRQNEYAHAMLAMLERFVDAHPEVYRKVGRREVGRALARRWARCAKHRLKAGDRAGAIAAFDRAVALAPASIRYRWNRILAARAPRSSPARP